MINNARSDKIVMTCIGALVILEAIALMNGINGIIFTMVVGAICAFGGLIIERPRFMK